MTTLRAPGRPAWIPPQTALGELWRTALSLAISALAWSQLAGAQWHHARALFWIDIGVGLASFPLVLLRRRWPLQIALLLSIAGAISASSSGPSTLAAVSYATRRRFGGIVTVGITIFASSWVYSTIEPRVNNDPKWLDLAFTIVIVLATLIYGMYVGSRRELIWSLRERAEVAERQQELRVQQARARERERIAREMHDVLAHRISLITMHAGALEYRNDLSAEQVADTARLISTTSHEALVDLREVLGALRETEPMRPQPTLAGLAELVAEAKGSGMTVLLDNSLTESAAVPERLGRAIYRMVQEALTNARKHAPGVPVQVGLSGSPGGGIQVSVRNGRSGFGRSRGSGGLGLIGMRERFELAGGHLDVVDGERWFVIEGWLPWQR